MVRTSSTAGLFQGHGTKVATSTTVDDPDGGARRQPADLRPTLAARAADHDRAGVFPEADFADLRDAGLMGLMAPTRLGGAGASFADYAEVAMALAEGNGATALVFNMHTSITGALASHARRGRPRARRTRLLLRHARPGAAPTPPAARSTPWRCPSAASGSRLSAVTTTYEPKGTDGYLIRGVEDLLLRRRATPTATSSRRATASSV